MFKLNLIVCVVALSFIFIICNSPTETQTETRIMVSTLQITSTDMPGWSQISANQDTFCTYPISGMYSGNPGSNDGGAVPYDAGGYTKDGCAEVSYQKITKPGTPGSNSFEGYAMDFKTSATAAAVFDSQKVSAGFTPFVPVPSFNNSVAIAAETLGGYSVCAHFKNVFILFSVSGYSDATVGLSDVGRFLTVYQSKIK